MNERLTKMVNFGILSKQSYAEVPPRVEYRLMDLGRRIGEILQAIEALQQDINDGD